MTLRAHANILGNLVAADGCRGSQWRQGRRFALAVAVAWLTAGVTAVQAATPGPTVHQNPVSPQKGLAGDPFVASGFVSVAKCPNPAPPLTFKFYWDRPSLLPLWTTTVSTCITPKAPATPFYNTGPSPNLVVAVSLTSLGLHTVELYVFDASGAQVGKPVNQPYTVLPPPLPASPSPSPGSSPTPTPAQATAAASAARSAPRPTDPAIVLVGAICFALPLAGALSAWLAMKGGTVIRNNVELARPVRRGPTEGRRRGPP